MNEKLSLLKELIKLSRVDKEVRDEEYQFLVIIAKTLGISNQELDDLFKKYIEFTPPKLEPHRILQFQRLVLLANVDLEIDKKELSHLKKAGFLLGLREEAINKVIQEMQNHERGLIPEKILIDIFKVFHN